MVFQVKSVNTSGSESFGPHINAKLDKWVELKRAKNFAAADALRLQLHAAGVHDPNSARPDPRPRRGGWSAGSVSATEPESYGPYLDAKLDQWVELKRAKNFAAADALREELRQAGIDDPNSARPDPRNVAYSAGTEPESFGPEIDAKLDSWVQFKRARNFAAADALEAELKAAGVDNPNSARPDRFRAPKSFGPEIDAKLDRWVQLKRARDFAAADALEAELKAEGVDDPNCARPKQGGKGEAGSKSFGPIINAKLDLWVQLKRSGNYAASDALEAELKEAGVNDPNSARPDPRRGGKAGGKGGVGDQTESVQNMMNVMMGSMLSNMMQNMGNGGHMGRARPY